MTRKAYTFDTDRLPKVEKVGSYGVYRAGNWTFDPEDEADLEYTRQAILSWIAWQEFLLNGGLDNE